MEGCVEQEIANSSCRGCANGQIQYLERAKINYLWYNKLLETREAMAVQFNEMAKVMENYTKPIYSEKKTILGMDDYIKHKLRENKVIARRIYINENSKGMLEVRLFAKKKKKTDVKSDVIKKVVSQALGKKVRLSMDSIVNITEDYNEYVLFCLLYTSVAAMQSKIDNIKGANYNVPSYIGEFNMMSNSDSWSEGVKLLNDNNFCLLYTSRCV